MADAFSVLAGFNPAWPLILGGLIALALPTHAGRKAVMILAPLVGLAAWFATREPGIYAVLELGPVGFGDLPL
jgi:hypothetical protein